MSYGDMICLAVLIGLIWAAVILLLLHLLEQWGFIARDGE